jgi:predicted anti-sigma-YlaC factor YlaD
MECREVREFLPAYDELGGSLQVAAIDRHLAGCAGCRTTLDQYRALSDDLAHLRHLTAEPPGWLLSTLTDAVAEAVRRYAVAQARRDRLTDPRLIAAGGAMLMTAAGVVGALLARQRRQRRRQRPPLRSGRDAQRRSNWPPLRAGRDAQRRSEVRRVLVRA